MTPESTLALFGVMLVLALVPGVSVLTVTARTASHGLRHGIITTLGIITGDIFYILIALLGLTILVDKLSVVTLLIKYIGAGWLVWLGTAMVCRPRAKATLPTIEATSLVSSFIVGLLITLADQKAIIFYLVFLLAFINLSMLSYMDIPVIMLLAVTAISIAKMVYVYMAWKARLLTASKLYQGLNQIAGGTLIVAGLYMVLKP